MKGPSYKQAFIFALVLCAALAASVVYLIFERSRIAEVPEESNPVVAKGPEISTVTKTPSSKTPTSETPTIETPTNETPTTENAPALMAAFKISPQRLQSIGVTTALVEWREASDELQMPGDVEINEQQLSYVQTRFPGWIQKVFANAAYQYVRKGQPLFTIYSQELAGTEQEYVLATQTQQSFSADAHGGATSEPAKDKDWLVQAAADRLRQFGVSPQEIANLEQTGKVSRDITVDSPVAGYITERNALPNLYVQPETKLYAIADLSTVWIYANVSQTDIPRLKPGDRAMVTLDAYPGRKFLGRIDQILPQLDVMTRTVRARLIVNNPGMLLKPGMYVNVAIKAPVGRRLVIPASGVLQAGTREIAFIDNGGGSLEPREIETGERTGDSVVVLKGLHAGERIVNSANFLVDSESQLQSAIGAFAAPLPAASPGAEAKSAESIIDFSSDPAPPHKGANTVRVKLTAAGGTPIIGAQISATFFMPAMPAMGMSEVRNMVTLIEKGGGVYQGTLQLPNGGTYKVSIVALRNGNPVAAKQLSVNVAGGV